jgi:RNA polymerase sigma-70 factor (ECF subfamily)
VNESEVSENVVISQVLAGRREAYRVLVERHQDRVFRMCCVILRDAGAAEDVTQEAFMKAFLHLRKFDDKLGSFGTWLLAIARRLCLNTLRKTTEQPCEEFEEPEAPQSTRPDNLAAQAELSGVLDNALDQLSLEFRTAFVLFEIEGVSYDEIAKIEEISIGTVKSRISRAKAALRGRLAQTFAEYTQQ